MNHIPVRFIAETEDERCERLLEEQWEAAREECLEDFREWQREGIRGLSERDWNPREDADFSEWLISMAGSHMRNHEKYEAALTWGERKRVGRGS